MPLFVIDEDGGTPCVVIQERNNSCQEKIVVGGLHGCIALSRLAVIQHDTMMRELYNTKKYCLLAMQEMFRFHCLINMMVSRP